MNEKRTGSAYDKCNIFVVIVPEIFHSGQPSHGGDRKTFEVMTSTCLLLHLLFIYSLIEKTVTVGALRIDVEGVLIDPLRIFLILICINDLILFTHAERVSKSSVPRFSHCLA